MFRVFCIYVAVFIEFGGLPRTNIARLNSVLLR